jgi:tetratricopeptide (TPR) repeat protein
MLIQENNPWLGLESYSINDSNRFYGRDSDIEIVSSSIFDNFITTIYGISGAGKTSLINAGITPLLKQSNFLPIRIRLKHETDESYCMQIINAICSSVEGIEGEVEHNESIGLENIHDTDRLWFFLHTRRFWTKDNYPIHPVILIDQFEEIFTQNSDTTKIYDFFESINAIQYSTPPLHTKDVLEKDESGYFQIWANKSRMVFIIREDFLARLEDYAYGIAALRRNRIGIKRMNGFQAKEVITKPAPGIISDENAIRILSKVAGKEVDPSKRSMERLSIDTSILSLFCSELYRRAAEEGKDSITEEIIEKSGGDIIQTFYERCMGSIDEELVTFLEADTHLLTSSGFRNSLAYEDIIVPKLSQSEISRGLDFLADKRIIRIEDTERGRRVEFTHDVLCAAAKRHREYRAMLAEKRKSIFKEMLSFMEIGTISLVTLLLLIITETSDKILSFIRPDWFAACGLFVILFVKRNKDRNRYISFGLSALLSLLLVRPNLMWIYNVTDFGNYLLFAMSLIAGAFVFLGNKEESKIPWYILIASDIAMMVLHNGNAFLSTFIILVLIASLPLKYSKDKYAGWLCVIATVLIFIAGIVLGSKYALYIALYPLLGVISGAISERNDRSSTFKESLLRTIRFETLGRKNTESQIPVRYPSFNNLCITFSSIVILMMWSAKAGPIRSDFELLYYTPIFVYLFLYLSVNVLAEINVFSKRIKINTDWYTPLGGIFLSMAALAMCLCQYITFGCCYLGAILVIVMAVQFLWCRKKGDALKVVLKKAAVPWVLSLFWIAIPSQLIGYDILKYPEYAKAPRKHLDENEFIVIKDNKGNYGVMDERNIIIPVCYADISPDVIFENIEYIEFLRNTDYDLAEGKWTDRIYGTYGLGHSWMRQNETSDFPDIVFTLTNKDGEQEMWHCNEHMSDRNICSISILESARMSVMYPYTYEFDEAYAMKYLAAAKEMEEDASEMAEMIVLDLFKESLDIHSVNDFEEFRVQMNDYAERHDHKVAKALNLSYKVMSYIDDDELLRYLLDTLYTPSRHRTQYERWMFYNNKAEYCLYANMFTKAESSAKEAIRQDSVLAYAYKNLIVAQVVQQRFEEAYHLLEKYGDQMLYMGACSDISRKKEELDIIHHRAKGISTSLRFDNLYNGVYNELMGLKESNVMFDQYSGEYLDFEAFVKSKCIRPYDSAEDKGGYYLCRKYKSYNSPLDEWYSGDMTPRYIIDYQFYMKDNVEMSPAFDTYAEGIDEDILLIIDRDDHKRKYLIKAEGNVEMIPGEFDHAWRFSEGLAAVSVNGKLGFIDRSGQYVIDSTFNYANDSFYPVDEYNRQTSDIVDYTFHGKLCIMKDNNGQYGLINKKAEWVVMPEYGKILYLGTMDLWLLMKHERYGDYVKVLYGAADADGKVIMDPIYDEFIAAKDSGYWGVNDNYTAIKRESDNPALLRPDYTLESYYDDEIYSLMWEFHSPEGVIDVYYDDEVRYRW